MSLTILEVLENAEYNLKESSLDFQKKLGLKQLSNAIILLNKGKDLEDDFKEEDLD